MRRKPRPAAALALVAMAAMVSACGSNAPAATGSGSNSGAGTATIVDKAVKFAECMRDNGVSDFPDPNASGQFTYGIKAGSSLDPRTSAWKQAISACKDLEPAGLIPTSFTSQQMRRASSSPDASARTASRTSRTPPTVVPSSICSTLRAIRSSRPRVQTCRSLMAAAAGGQ